MSSTVSLVLILAMRAWGIVSLLSTSRPPSVKLEVIMLLTEGYSQRVRMLVLVCGSKPIAAHWKCPYRSGLSLTATATS